METTQTSPRERQGVGIAWRLIILHAPLAESVGRARVLAHEPLLIGRDPDGPGAEA